MFKFTKNFHTHTALCNHASGSMRDYVTAAISCGMETLGFSDHVPYPFKNGLTTYYAMSIDEIEGYVAEALSLREEFKDKIDIKIGYEAEYYPAHFEDLQKLISKFPCDYLILGQHFTNNRYDGEYSGADTTDVSVLERYVSQSCEAMRLGVFTYFAHPDLVGFVGPANVYLDVMSEICRTSLETDTPLELNLLGIHDRRRYPREDLWHLVGEYGCKVVIGCDAHEPEAVNNGEDFHRAVEIAEKYHLNYIDNNFVLRDPFANLR